MLLKEVPTNSPFQAATRRSPLPRSLERAACQCHSRLAAAPALDRRSVLAASLAVAFLRSSPARASQPANIRLDLTPDQAQYDAGDERLRDAAQMLQQALNADSVQVHAYSNSCILPARGAGWATPCEESLRGGTGQDCSSLAGGDRRRSACGRCS